MVGLRERIYPNGRHEYFVLEGTWWELREKYVLNANPKKEVAERKAYKDREQVQLCEYYAAKELAGLREETDGPTKPPTLDSLAEFSQVMSIFT